MLECPNCGGNNISTERRPDGDSKCSCGFSDKTHGFIAVDEKRFFKQEYMLPLASQHPLLNPDSPHYSMVDGIESIERMEQMYTVEELMVWAKITAMKYRLRIGKKDDVSKESKKIETYEAYYSYLKGKANAK